jgi:sulfur carrier protein ThiS
MTIDGERMSFSSSQYTGAQDFHFHGSGPRWHMHPNPPERLTLAEAMQRLGIELGENSVTVEGQTYDASDSGTSLTVRVNGEPVTPSAYELQESDHVRITVQTEN